MSVDWTGQASEQLRARTFGDMTTVNRIGDRIEQAAKTARAGASELYAARSHLRYAVEDAHSAGFEVGDDLSITDPGACRSPMTMASRRALAHNLALDIRQRAMQLVSLDQQVAARITIAFAELRTMLFDDVPARPREEGREPPRRNGIQLVDNGSWKDAPGPPPNPPSTPTAQEVQEVIRDLPRGNRPFIKEIRSEADLRKLLDWLSEGATERNPASSYKGIERVLSDGTIVGIRQDAEFGLTMDIRSPDKNYVRIHINSERGGVPNIARPLAQPVAPPQIEPRPSARVPVEPAPAAAPPARLGPSPILGPVPPESIPHPVQLPHSHHDLPVLGKDELSDLPEFNPE